MVKPVAVVILNWNGKSLLERFLAGVVQHSPEAEVVVADNASTDDSINFLKKEFPQIKIIINSKNFGFAGGYNEALKHVDTEYYVLLNSDVEVTPGWLQPLLDVMREPGAGAAQPRVLDLNNRNFFEYAGAAGGFIDRWGYPFCRGRIFNDLEQDHGQYDETMEVFWATGACMVVKKEVFDKLHGFDEDFFAHMEEIDLCWRIKNAGYKIFCVPQSVVYHLGGGTLNKYSPRKTYLNFRNNLMMMIKNLPAKKLLRTIFVRLILDGVAAIKFLFVKNGLQHFLAVARAHFYIYGNISRLKYKRKNTIQSYTTKIYKKNIVFRHFISGVKKFSELDLKDFS